MCAGAQRVEAQDKQGEQHQESEVVYLRLDYASLDDVFIGAHYAYRDDAFYLSLADLFRALQLDLEVRPADSLATGFFLDEATTYRIDAGEGTARVGDSTYTLAPSDVVATELDLYVRPHVLARWFDFDLRADMRSLSVYLETDEPMPVIKAQLRARERRRLMRAGPLEEELLPPLLYGRQPRALAGGVASYDLGVSFIDDPLQGLLPTYRMNVAGGMELLGADLELAFNAIGTGTDLGMEFQRVRWRYVPSPNVHLREAQMGTLRSTGLKSFQYYGVRLANEPVRFRNFYGYYRVEGRTEPGWEVELYLNSRLVDFQTTSAGGRYEFRIPLSYGTTLATVRMYGPAGQSDEVVRRLQVPFTFVPPGEIYYTIDMGRTVRNPAMLSQSTMAFGLTNWLTNLVGVDYLDPLEGAVGRRPWRIYNKLVARAGSYLLSLNAAPSVSYGANIQAYFASLASADASFEWFEEAAHYNPLGVRHQLGLQVNAPVRVGSVPMNVRLSGRRQQLMGGLSRYTLRPGLLLQLGSGLRISNDLALTLSSAPARPLTWSDARSTTRFTYAVSRREQNPLLLRGMLLTGALGYNIYQRQFETLQLMASRDITRWGRVRLQFGHNFTTGSATAGLQLVFNLPAMRTTTNMRWTPQGAFVSQNVGGSVSLDPAVGDLVFERRSWIGKSTVSMRMFTDYNGNDRYDEGEHIIEDGDLRFWQATPTRRSGEGLLYAYNLRPYTRYNASINLSSIQNPLWIPKADSFSLVTDPNRIKTIDIPFYVGGIITGSVLRKENQATYAIPGLRVYVMRTDGDFEAMLPVYTDGSFYHMGLPPGEYRAEVDPAQLEILGLAAVPAVRTFTVEVTRDGDYVRGIDFLLEARP